MAEFFTSEKATKIGQLAQKILQQGTIPDFLQRQRHGFRQILDAKENLRAMSSHILDICAGIDRDNAEHYSTIPETALIIMDTTVREIRELLTPRANGKTPAPSAPLQRNPLPNVITPVQPPTLPPPEIPQAPVATKVTISKPAPVAPPRLISPKEVTQSSDKELIDFGAEHGIITRSLTMEDALDNLKFVAGLPAGHVLIRGETGTGKELFSSAVHKASQRNSKPFVIIDGASVDSNLMKDDLFGHEKGAFTGADKIRKGKLEIAEDGVVFIDEIGKWNKDAQGILLGVLEGRPIERIGKSDNPIPMRARIVAATNADLEDMVNKGFFLEDLYYRLQRLRIELPPLRERGKIDVEALAHHFLAEARKTNNINREVSMDELALESLTSYSWPGNVRQLKHVMEQTLVNVLREQARQKRLLRKAEDEISITKHHVDAALETYRRLEVRQESKLETAI